jgi:ribosome-associated translation inhibitor RaiA
MPLTPTQVVFQGLDRSEAVAAAIRGHVAWLEHYSDTLIGCRVSIEMPHRHRLHGRSIRVTIEATLAGIAPVVAAQDDENMSIAITDAFAAARRQLQDAIRVRRHFVKVHEPQTV